MSRWVPQVIETLAECKRQGIVFDAAWGLASHKHAPRLHELGVPRYGQDSLLNQDAARAVE